MPSKREIRLLRRENAKLRRENIRLIAKNNTLINDNKHFSIFADLILTLMDDTSTETDSHQRCVKLFH